MDVDSISQTLQASKTLNNVYPNSVVLEVELSPTKCKLLFLTTMERYNPLLLTFEIFKKKTC